MAHVSEIVLDAMEREGWTPEQVRALVAAYREIMLARGRLLAFAAELQDEDRAWLTTRAVGERIVSLCHGAP